MRVSQQQLLKIAYVASSHLSPECQDLHNTQHLAQQHSDGPSIGEPLLVGHQVILQRPPAPGRVGIRAKVGRNRRPQWQVWAFGPQVKGLVLGTTR